jgi:hypothetical protein
VWEGYFEIVELCRYAKAVNEAQFEGCMAIRGRPSLAGIMGEPCFGNEQRVVMNFSQCSIVSALAS